MKRPSWIRLRWKVSEIIRLSLRNFYICKKKKSETKFSSELGPLVLKTSRNLFPPCWNIHCFSFFLLLKLTGLICSWNWGQSWFRNSPMRQKGLTTNLSLFFAQIVFNIVKMRRDGMRGKLENCFCLKSEKQPQAGPELDWWRQGLWQKFVSSISWESERRAPLIAGINLRLQNIPNLFLQSSLPRPCQQQQCDWGRHPVSLSGGVTAILVTLSILAQITTWISRPDLT